MFATLTLVQVALALANLTLAINLAIRLRRVKALEEMLTHLHPGPLHPRPRETIRPMAPEAPTARPQHRTGPGCDPTLGFRDPYR